MFTSFIYILNVMTIISLFHIKSIASRRERFNKIRQENKDEKLVHFIIILSTSIKFYQTVFRVNSNENKVRKKLH